MSKIVVNLGGAPEKPETVVQEQETVVRAAEKPAFLKDQQPAPKDRSGMKKALGIIGIALGFILIACAIGGYFYWQNLKSSPQYSLALLVDAARRNDQKTLDELIDTDAIVEDFMPQVTDKAVELYGRGLPPATIQKISQMIVPLMPTIKQRARAEVPGFIREKTQPFESYPFWALAIGAPRYIEIVPDGDKAYIKSKIPQRPLELTMKRKGEIWQVVAVRDEVLARKVAEKIGQDLIAAAKKSGVKTVSDQIDVQSLKDALNNPNGIFK